MKGFFAFALFVAYVCLVNAKATKEISDKLRASTKKCITENKLDPKNGEAIIKFQKAPVTDDEKCAVLCYMKEMGYVKDGKFLTDVVTESNKQKWDDAATAEKATILFKNCLPTANPKNEPVNCAIAANLLTCVKTGLSKSNIPVPVLA